MFKQICKSLSMHWALWMSVVLKSLAVVVVTEQEEPETAPEEWQTNHSLREKLLGIDAAQMVAALQVLSECMFACMSAVQTCS